jgi:hypothetical protein
MYIYEWSAPMEEFPSEAHESSEFEIETIGPA